MAKTVTLTAPDGSKVTVADAISLNTLVYGQGYKVDGGKTPDQALAALHADDEPAKKA